MFLFKFLFIYIIPILLFAQSIDLNSKEQILERLNTLSSSEDEEYEKVIFSLNREVESYISMRQKECLGEFSILEINTESENSQVTQRKKLSKEEQKLCQVELINFRKKYVNIIFEIRKKHLVKKHSEQLQELDQYRQKNLSELDRLSKDFI